MENLKPLPIDSLMIPTNNNDSYNKYNESLYKDTNDSLYKDTNDSFYTETITYLYNKKWLILFAILIFVVIFYIYNNDIVISIPCPGALFQNKKVDSSSDDITEFNDDKDWNLEEEITQYMELQDTYIKNIK